MYKVCFDNLNNIVGFDISSPTYINLFDINDTSKYVTKYNDVQIKDSLGRNMYYQYDKKNDITTNVTFIQDNYGYQYTPMISSVAMKVKLTLVNNSNNFSIEDIIEEKNKQLISKYNCNNCLLYELINDSNDIKFNTNIGKNIIKINANSEIISNEIQLTDNNKISVYCETDNDIKILISNDQKTWIEIQKDQFLDYKDNVIFIKLISIIETNIYCIAILTN